MIRTKYEITRDINNYEYLKRQYNNMLDKLQDAKWYLNNSSEKISTIKSQINQGFMVNNNGADKNKLKDIESNINASKSRVINTLIPKVQNKISSITTKLRRLYNELAGAK